MTITSPRQHINKIHYHSGGMKNISQRCINMIYSKAKHGSNLIPCQIQFKERYFVNIAKSVVFMSH